MINPGSFRLMIKGWHEKYLEILKEFHYDRIKEIQAANVLDWLLEKKSQPYSIRKKISGKAVFVIGAGPSLDSAISHIKKFKNITNIVADGSAQALLEHDIVPDIIVTDLDGDIDSLRKASELGSIMVVHAHGDNIQRLPYSTFFQNCIGTTEDKQVGMVKNFGGFTDGDRCVFLAEHFGAKKIILIGMDFGTKIGRYSKQVVSDRSTKIRKLEKAKSLLEWLASNTNAKLYTTTYPIKGFENMRISDLRRIIS
jgi:uncharacterized Rossmann fold enzyme